MHRNPIDIEPAIDLAAYPWSSHAAYLGWAPTPKWLSTGAVLRHFGDDRAELQEFVETRRPSDTVGLMRPSIRPKDTYTGPARSISKIAPADVQRAVADTAGIDVRLVQQPLDRRQKRARAAALLLCVDEFFLAPKTLTDTFGFATPGALRTALSRARKDSVSDIDLSELLSQSRRLLGG